MKKILLSVLLAVFILFNSSGLVFAQKSIDKSNGSGVLCGKTGINTAIGCLDVLGSQEQFLGDLLKWAVGVGGGIAFLLIVYAGFMIMTSSGNPERLKAGQELLTSALSGLILLILSVFILNLIGVKILKIPGFGGEINQSENQGQKSDLPGKQQQNPPGNQI